jgi:hypothetical protein
MKFISELACILFILAVMGSSASVNAVPRTDTEELYSEAIYMHRNQEETPSAFESSARLVAEDDAVDYYSTASDTVDLEPVDMAPQINGKKLSARSSRKKTSRN